MRASPNVREYASKQDCLGASKGKRQPKAKDRKKREEVANCRMKGEEKEERRERRLPKKEGA